MPTCCCMSWMRQPQFPEQMAEVQRVLAEIGASTVSQVLVFNKLDAIENDRRPLHLTGHV
jgi:GTP-binding protein HflX